ncbi:MAG: hypothetical protein QM758_05485 [Armatimonas sp.]
MRQGWPSYAFVIQVSGWEGLELNTSKKQGVRSAFLRAELSPETIRFQPEGVAFEPMTSGQIEAMRHNIEDEFGTVAYNSHGQQDKKLERRDRHSTVSEDEEAY